MLAHISVKISANILESKLKELFMLDDWTVESIWHDDADFVIHLDGKAKLKIKIQIVSHKKTFLGFHIKRIVVNDLLPISGDLIGLIMSSFKKVIERKIPLAVIKVDGDTIYLENIKTNDIKLSDDKIIGNIFYEP